MRGKQFCIYSSGQQTEKENKSEEENVFKHSEHLIMTSFPAVFGSIFSISSQNYTICFNSWPESYHNISKLNKDVFKSNKANTNDFGNKLL